MSLTFCVKISTAHTSMRISISVFVTERENSYSNTLKYN